jgi:hypothetical protein
MTMKHFILLSFLVLLVTPKITAQKIRVDSYSKKTHYIYRSRYNDSLFNLKSLESITPDEEDHNFRQHIFDLDSLTSTYYGFEDSSVLNIKVEYITNTKMIIHILEDENDYGYVIDIDPRNELFYRYDSQLKKFIELNTYEYVIYRSM